MNVVVLPSDLKSLRAVSTIKTVEIAGMPFEITESVLEVAVNHVPYRPSSGHDWINMNTGEHATLLLESPTVSELLG